MKPAAFLFDLDGTLVDTEAAWTRAIVDFVVSRGGKTTFEDILPTVIGRNWLDIDRGLHERFPVIGDSNPMDDARELRVFYDAYAANPSSMRIEGTIAFFRRAASVAPCAIVSGSPHNDVVDAAKMCGIDDCVSLVLGAGEYEAGKPSPSGYMRAAEILQVNPAQCVVVEDSEVGIAAGLGAGIYGSPEEATKGWQKDLEFTPRMDEATRLLNLKGWHKAVEKSLGWAKD